MTDVVIIWFDRNLANRIREDCQKSLKKVVLKVHQTEEINTDPHIYMKDVYLLCEEKMPNLKAFIKRLKQKNVGSEMILCSKGQEQNRSFDKTGCHCITLEIEAIIKQIEIICNNIKIKEHPVKIVSNRKTVVLDRDDIIFIQKVDRKLEIHTFHSIYTTNSSLIEFYKKSEGFFVFSDESILVHPAYIKEMDIDKHLLLLKTGDNVYLSRRCYQRIKRYY